MQYFTNGRFGKYKNKPNFLEECSITGIILSRFVHSANRTKIISWEKQKNIPVFVTEIDKHSSKIVFAQ